MHATSGHAGSVGAVHGAASEERACVSEVMLIRLPPESMSCIMLRLPSQRSSSYYTVRFDSLPPL